MPGMQAGIASHRAADEAPHIVRPGELASLRKKAFEDQRVSVPARTAGFLLRPDGPGQQRLAPLADTIERAMAQQDPVVEFRREGYEMFVAMLDGLKEECVAALFRD
mgnify:CR=1 FL=1